MKHLDIGIEVIEVNDIKGGVQSGGSAWMVYGLGQFRGVQRGLVRVLESGWRGSGVGLGILIQVQSGIS